MYQKNGWKDGEWIQAPKKDYPTRQFKLIKLLGEGSEAQVFQAQSINWNWNQNQLFALKIHYETERAEYITFLDNIMAYQNKYESNCNDQNYKPSQIIRIFDKFEHQKPTTSHKQLIVVMELGQQDLYQYIKQSQKINLQYCQQIIHYISKSVLFLHSNNMFHRDLKPENFIFVGQQVKLIDFGFIKQQNDNIRQTPNIGSIIFQAPEVIQGKTNYSFSVDIWSLGCVFYEIITNKQLIQYTTLFQYQDFINNKSQLLQNDLYDKVQLLGIPETWKTIIKNMLSIQPNKRPSINDIVKIFENNNTLQQIIIQPPINQYPNPILDPNRIGFDYQQQNNSNRHGSLVIPNISNFLQEPQVDLRVFQTEVQNNQQSQNVRNQITPLQAPIIIGQQNLRQNFNIDSNIIIFQLQVKSNNEQIANRQIFQDSNNDFKELNQSIQNKDESLQKLKLKQIEQQKIIEYFQSEQTEIQKLEATIQENNQKISNFLNQLKNKQDLNTQITIQNVNFQQLKEIEIKFQTQQSLKQILDDIKNFKEKHSKLGDQIIKEKSMIQQEIQQIIDQIKQLESQVQNEKIVVDNSYKEFQNFQVENDCTIQQIEQQQQKIKVEIDHIKSLIEKQNQAQFSYTIILQKQLKDLEFEYQVNLKKLELNNMKSALKVKFDEYKDFLSRILKIIQSNEIIIKKVDMNKKI